MKNGESLTSIVLAGGPLGGKTCLLELLARATGAAITGRRTVVPSGFLKGAPITLLELKFTDGANQILVSVAGGGMPIEVYEMLLPDADLAVFVIDGREVVRDRDIEYWQKLASATKANWIFILNRRPDVTGTAAGVMQAVGIDADRDCLDISALNGDGSRVRDFLLAALNTR
jgi:tRNA U34 5-carboxymethylaminomethyl modifying GTPase MnmE/TrmE